MRPVMQKIVSRNMGDCMRAAWASVLELPLSKIPDFLNLKRSWYLTLIRFLRRMGYGYSHFNIHIQNTRGELIKKTNYTMAKKALKFDGGFDGYFVVGVPSQTYKFPITHAVVIDSGLNIVHDPNPNQKALALDHKSILDVHGATDGWYFGKKKIMLLP